MLGMSNGKDRIKSKKTKKSNLFCKNKVDLERPRDKPLKI